jgi:branched-chain amino acid transport system permease protein
VVLVAFREGTRYLPDVGGSPTLLPSLRFVVIGLLLILVVRFRPAGLFGDPDELVLAGDEQ